MRLARFVPFLICLAAIPATAATFGTVTAGSGGSIYTDIVFDEPRQRLYLVSSSGSRIDIYSLQQRAFLSPVKTDTLPLAVAMSPDGTTLYVTAFSASALDIIDLTKTTLTVTTRVPMPASPEGVAVGGDGRVLISTVGNAGQNVLLIYDPAATSGKNLNNVAVTPSAPTPPTVPAPSPNSFASGHSSLLTSADGNYIIGDNLISTGTTFNSAVFIYEVSSGTVLRSRTVTNLSNVLSVAPDGSKFMAGSSLFDAATLAIIAQENVANSPFAFAAAANFNTQVNQGGSIFSPDGTAIWAAFNFAPVQSPAARANVTRLLQNDPDNLLIKLGLQLPENLSGKMVRTSSGDTVYALSESGFITLPIATVTANPIAQADSVVVLVASDPCGVSAKIQAATVNVTNAGRGRVTASVQTYTVATTGVASLGTTTAAAGGGTTILGPGGTIITLPGGAGGFGGGGGGILGGGAGVPGGGTVTPVTTAATTGTVPSVQTRTTSNGVSFTFAFNSRAATTLGTTGPSDFLVQSPEAINIPNNIRVYQNSRSSEQAGNVLVTQQNISTGETLMDMAMDAARQRIYVANSGLNQVEVLDMKTQSLMPPIKVGQLPHGLALGTDGTTLYVVNTGGESISMVDLNKMQTAGRVVFPPIPANASVALTHPVAIANSERGPQFIMSDGTIWRVDGNQAVPRVLPAGVFGGTLVAPVKTIAGGNPSQFSMAGTPGGEYILVVTGAGNAYLYDAGVDDFTLTKQIFTTPISGFIGPISAGPKGAYYLANGTVLNSSLTPTTNALTGGTAATSRPVAAVAAISATSYALFTEPIRTAATTVVTDAGMVQITNLSNNATMGSFSSLEGPASIVTTNGRATIPGRSMLIDSAGGNAYVLTTTGISIVPLTTVSPVIAPRVNTGGVVNLASSQTAVAPGSLISIFGRGLGTTATFSSTPLPTILGGTCVTLNNVPLPLELASEGQINAQLPIGLAAGRYPLVVHSTTNQIASGSTTITVTKNAPAVFVSGTQAAIVHTDGSYVTPDHPANRDEDLVIYGTGFGATTGGAVITGIPAPISPLAVTAPVQVYFGTPGYSQAAMIVVWSGLVPGLIGVNQINIRVPGDHINGDALPVTVKVGGVLSSTSGPAIPTVAVQ